jgi:hypothetical protein
MPETPLCRNFRSQPDMNGFAPITLNPAASWGLHEVSKISNPIFNFFPPPFL